MHWKQIMICDFVVNMLPGSLGNQMTSILKDSNLKIVDLSFSETTPDTLTDVSSSILWDVGIAPGLSNMLVAMAVREFGILDEVTIKVGGNPAQPDGEWSYMAPFSLMTLSLNTQDLQGLSQIAKSKRTSNQ